MVPVAADVCALWPTPFGLLLQRRAAAGATALEALLHPLDEGPPVALPPGAALCWSDAALPLVRAFCGAGGKDDGRRRACCLH